MKKRMKWLIVPTAVMMIRCMALTGYHTGQVLPPGQVDLMPAWNSLIWWFMDEDEFSHGIGILPGIGIYSGLPGRFEAGLRYTVPTFMDGTLRWQLNPGSFRWVDASVNYTVGSMYIEENYLLARKYGVTISREIGKRQPFISLHRWAVGFPRSRDGDDDPVSIVSGGMAFRNERGDLIVPELTIILHGNEHMHAMWMFGFAIRIPLNKKNERN